MAAVANDTGRRTMREGSVLGERCGLSLRCAAADDTLIPSRDKSPQRPRAYSSYRTKLKYRIQLAVVAGCLA